MKNEGNDISKAKRVTWLGFWVNAILGVAKVVGGIVGHSSALVADGIHSFSDFLSDIIVLVMIGVSRRKPDHSHQFGHGKFETLATLLLGIILIIVAIGIFADALREIIAVANGKILDAPSPIALIILLFAIASKEWLFHITLRVGKQINSQAVIANAWHHRSDSFSSIATLVGVVGALLLGERWRVLDPAAAMVVSFFIATVGVKAVRPALNELLGRSLPDNLQMAIKQTIASSPQVRGYHDLRTTLSGKDCIVEIHLTVDPWLTVIQTHEMSLELEKKIKDALKPYNALVTIHFEPDMKTDYGVEAPLD